MAERRMIAKSIIDSDAFLDMPLSTQALYFHLCMRADDEGFISNPKKIQRMASCSNDDLNLLILKRYVLVFQSGVIVIKHWKIHNYIRGDRFKPTLYSEEKKSLFLKKDGAYTDHPLAENSDGMPLGIPSDIPNDNQTRTQVRKGKVRKGKDRLGKVNSCAESEPASPPIFTLPLNTGDPYPITREDIDGWASLYPAVDIEQEIRKMQGWCGANPKRRKTERGIKAFITGWLSREQDRGHRPQNNPAPRKSTEGQELLDMIARGEFNDNG